MREKIIEVSAERGYGDTLCAIAEQYEALDWTITLGERGERETVRMLISGGNRQKVVDKIQSVLQGAENWRLTIIPIDGTLPQVESDQEEQNEEARKVIATREELYMSVESGAIADRIFFTLVTLSTLVASIGLVEDNVAAVIGAMVIAPLLGPNLAFAFAAAVGDHALMLRATLTNLAGLFIPVFLSAAMAFIFAMPLDAPELVSRSDAEFDSIVLALASGAAAALSLTTGLSSTLVGVMVAVALLPPAASLGIFIGGGAYEEAAGAAILLGVNMVSVNLAALVVFVMRGIRPHKWYERGSAQQSTILNIAVSILLLLAALFLIFVRHQA